MSKQERNRREIPHTYFRNNQTGKVKKISLKGWKLLATKTYMDGKVQKNLYSKATKEDFEKQSGEHPIDELNAAQVLIKANDKGLIERDGDDVLFEDEVYNAEELLQNEVVIQRISNAIKECKNC